MNRIIILLTLLVLSCSIVRKFAGADIDPEEFALARKARMLEVQSTAFEKQLNYLSKGGVNQQADIVIKINESFLNKLASQYNNASGWLDNENSFTIQSTKIALSFGSATASISLLAHNHKYNVDVNLVSDCIVQLERNDTTIAVNISPVLKMKLVPYNIDVDVAAYGVVSYFKEIVKNLVKINLGNLEKSLPPIQIPLEFENKINIPQVDFLNKEKVNLQFTSKSREISLNAQIKEILIFDGFALISANFNHFVIR